MRKYSKSPTIFILIEEKKWWRQEYENPETTIPIQEWNHPKQTKILACIPNNDGWSPEYLNSDKWVKQQWRLFNITHMASYILMVISCHTQATRCICVNNVIRIIQFELYTTKKKVFYMQTKMAIYHIIWVQLATVDLNLILQFWLISLPTRLFVFKQLRRPSLLLPLFFTFFLGEHTCVRTSLWRWLVGPI